MKNAFMFQKRMMSTSPYLYSNCQFRQFSSKAKTQFENWEVQDNQTISEVEVTSSTSEVTSVDADKPINFPPLDDKAIMFEEPRFLEQV
jgi:hypothetical protein